MKITKCFVDSLFSVENGLPWSQHGYDHLRPGALVKNFDGSIGILISVYAEFNDQAKTTITYADVVWAVSVRELDINFSMKRSYFYRSQLYSTFPTSLAKITY